MPTVREQILCDRPAVKALLLVLVVACGGAAEPAAPASGSVGKPTPGPVGPGPVGPGSASAPLVMWTVPAGYRGEVIPFPLGFAPSLAHRGVEELRFAPGFFEPDQPGYWSYAFTWRTEDAADLDAATLGGELTAYFKGLIAAVDEKQRITARDEIRAHAEVDGPGRFKLTAHVFDAFKTAKPLDLVGWAERRPCGSGALWVFVLAPRTSTLHGELDALARSTRCGQPLE